MEEASSGGHGPWRRLGLRIGLRLGLVLLFGALGFAAWQVALLGPERARELLQQAGAWAPVVYVLSFALLEPFGVMGIFFVGPGSLIWEWRELFVLSWLGAVGAGVVGFWFARTLGRDWVASRIPARLRDYEARLERHALVGVVLVRLLLFLWPPAHWMLGLSRVRFLPFLLGSAIGFLPGMAAFTWLGSSIMDAMLAVPVELVLAVLALGLASVWLLRRLHARRSGARDRAGATP